MKSIWHDVGQEYKKGMISSVIGFDGISCPDQYQKPRFTSQQNFATAELNLREDVRSFTIEFWMKTETTSQRSRAIMMSLSPESQRGQQVIQVGKEGLNMVYCYPQMSVDFL